MSELDLNIENIQVELSKDILSGNEIVAILNNPAEYPAEIIEKLSIETALRYWDGERVTLAPVFRSIFSPAGYFPFVRLRMA
jgi:hypothetical protein